MVDRTEALVLQMSADIRKMEKALSQARGQTNRQLSAVEKRFDQMNAHIRRSGDEMARDLRTAVAGIGVAFAIREVTQYADAWTTARNKLAAAGIASEDLAQTQSRLTDLALETRTSLEATVDLYARLTRSTDTLGVSQEQVFRATQIANQAFKAGGAAASEQASAVLQLGQALGSGVLQGDELRSLRENAPLLAKAIADEFETNVAGLKKLGETGQLTSVRVFQAILNAGVDIEAQFKSTTSTIGDAFTNLQSAFARFIGQNDQASGASKLLAGFINDVANNLDRLADAAIIAAQVIGGTLAAGAMIALVAQLATLVKSVGAASAAMVGLRAAMAFLSGPVGLVITAIGAGVAAFAISAGNAGTETQKLDRNLKDLSATIEANKTALEAAGITVLTTQLTEAEKAAAALEDRMAGLRAEAEKSGAWGRDLAASQQWEANFRVRQDIAALEANPTERVFVDRKFMDVPKYSPSELKKLVADRKAVLAQGEQLYLALLNAPRAAFAKSDAVIPSGNGNATPKEVSLEDMIARLGLEPNNPLDGLSTDVPFPYDMEAVWDEMNASMADIDWEIAGEALRQVMRDSIKNALREGIRTGDWGDSFSMILADAVTTGLDDALSRIGDWLADFLFADNGMLTNLANSAGSWIFGQRAGGGAAMAGRGYRVNDRGDSGEFLFMGSNPGQVLRQSEMAGMLGGGTSSPTVVNANLTIMGSVDAVTWPKVQEAMRQQARQIMSAVPATVNATLIDNRIQKRRI
jgi:tape measure domain-containing protein